MPYFEVADLDGALGTATARGGTMIVGPAPIPGTGRFVVIADPQGAMFALFER